MDSMFIDEGFGSLSQGELSNAMNMLAGLSKENKLIGIISHVEVLQDRIPRQILVTKSRAGSTAAVRER